MFEYLELNLETNLANFTIMDQKSELYYETISQIDLIQEDEKEKR